jgi:hypothetical protein
MYFVLVADRAFILLGTPEVATRGLGTGLLILPIVGCVPSGHRKLISQDIGNSRARGCSHVESTIGDYRCCR